MRIKPFWRNPLPASPRSRSLVGLLLATALIPILLTVTACLKAPIGNPETARVDPKLAGAWLSKNDGNKEETLFVFRPYDKRTYLVSWFDLSKGIGLEGKKAASDSGKDSSPEEIVAICKGWLTELAGKRFICLEPMYRIDPERGMKPEGWFTFRIELEGDRLSMQSVDEEEAGETTQQIEKNLSKKIKEGTLQCGEVAVLHRVAQSDYDKVAHLFKRTGLDFQ